MIGPGGTNLSMLHQIPGKYANRVLPVLPPVKMQHRQVQADMRRPDPGIVSCSIHKPIYKIVEQHFSEPSV